MSPRAFALGVALLAGPGCAGVGGVPLRDALHLVYTSGEETYDEQVLLSSTNDTCAQQQALLDGAAMLDEAPWPRWPSDWSDRSDIERFCQEEVERAELEASVYGEDYQAGSWRLRLSFWGEDVDGVQAGVFSPRGGGDGFVQGEFVEVLANPYDDYLDIDYSCADYASAYLDLEDAPFDVPRTPTLEDLHEDLDQSRLASGDVRIEVGDSGLRLTVEGGELADNYGRYVGDLALSGDLETCTLSR